jgi:HPt (histidine-containing phosphotransfer) domain-containing protein
MTSQLAGTAAVARLDVARGVGMMGSEPALRKILVAVVGSLETDLPAIQGALQARDVVTANRLLHAIKGYMPIFGTDAMVELVAAVEKLSKTESAETLRPHCLRLEPELQGLLTEIQSFLNPDA